MSFDFPARASPIQPVHDDPRGHRCARASSAIVLAFETDQFSVRIVSARVATVRDGDIRQAQRLRYRVFAEEMGAHLAATSAGIDEDIHDAWCDHLVVRDKGNDEVVGTYRILAPAAAQHVGYYSDTEFFTTRLNRIKPNLVEFGRSCIHPDYRSGPVIMLLWTALARYMVGGGYEHVIGCASVSMRDGGHQAASLFHRLRDQHTADADCHVFPRHPLPLDRLSSTVAVEAPPLIRGYLRIGGQICGDPAWDPDFNTADFFVLLSLSRMNPRYAKHFGLNDSVDQRLAA